ncbi:MAG: TetR/AcrR family transcriptional regulator [Bacteroidales bacterium]|nr:TetR/AcrR family transcriptional regulator [Bacteroidales bacterium]
MSKIDLKTETKILNAAKKVFVRKGLDGTRMQEIADEAGINKSLLHYYFRSKEKLFEAVFNEAFRQFIPKVSEAIESDIPFFRKIEIFVDTYISMLINNPHIPIFVLHEINRNPDKLISFMQSQGLRPEILLKSAMKEIEQKRIINIDPRHLVINMLGMCIFPFIAKPILKGVIFNNNEKAFMNFIQERKKEIPKFIINSIKKK